ncbi:cysteine-rich CWC family protein [Pseudomonas cichorii]|uniref:cysteine-rich CWC family protein n=1 Tax=Pseudomonas cichorii TaxID=36746 RepID=UPI001C8A1834|nr:cysteine-rich CWC family protein [Pseudomonas cichorii]MBX8494519.1 cysteine-rich CWC family protein [Pseudomonas cichorii]
MNTATTNTDPSLCPACGFSNSCTLADPRTVDQACWCFSQSIDPAVLQALPAELRNQACLCPRCAGVADSLQAKPLR